MMKFQIVFDLLILLMIVRQLSLYRKGEFGIRQLLARLFVWTFVLSVITFPEETQILAHYFGITRGVDLVIYSSIMVILIIMFKIYERCENLQTKLTVCVRKLAILEKELEQGRKNCDENSVPPVV